MTPPSATTRAVMAAIEHTLVVELLGSYQGLLDERERLLAEPDAIGWMPTDRAIRRERSLLLEQNQRMLDLYAALEREAARIVGANHEG